MDEPLKIEKEHHMKHVPNRLECAYCIRNHNHGGECGKCNYTTDEKGCLIFEPDERGCIREEDRRIDFPLYREIPPLDIWQDGWTIGGIDTQIKILFVNGLKWDKQNGCLVIYCRIAYFINEFHEDYKDPEKRPKLKIIK